MYYLIVFTTDGENVRICIIQADQYNMEFFVWSRAKTMLKQEKIKCIEILHDCDILESEGGRKQGKGDGSSLSCNTCRLDPCLYRCERVLLRSNITSNTEFSQYTYLSCFQQKIVCVILQ